jgi:hypothetical protein
MEMEDPPSLDPKGQVSQSTPPVQERRFVSVTTDALQNEYMAFKDHNLAIVERVRAGHRFLGVAASILGRSTDTKQQETGKKVSLFIEGYVSPRIRISIIRTGDDTPAYRLTVGGPSEASSDVAISDLQAGLKAVEDQRHEDYYNKVLSPIMGLVIVELARMGVVDEKPPALDFSFAHLTEVIDGDGDEEDDDAE